MIRKRLISRIINLISYLKQNKLNLFNWVSCDYLRKISKNTLKMEKVPKNMMEPVQQTHLKANHEYIDAELL